MGIDGISGGGMRTPQAWQVRREAKQVAEPDPRAFEEVVPEVPDPGATAGMSGLTALEYARRVDEIRRTTVPDVTAIDQAGLSQHNFVNPELQTLPVLWQDDNQIRPRRLGAMGDGA